MSTTFSYAVRTRLDRDRVWELFTNIENWPRFCTLFHHLRWVGEPWQIGSVIAGELTRPLHIPLSYSIKGFEPPDLIGFLAQSSESGFATERTILFLPCSTGTVIEIASFGVGHPPIAGGMQEFLQQVVVDFFANFAAFCDKTARTQDGIGPKISSRTLILTQPHL